MKKNWIIWGVVAVGAFLIYRKMKKSNDTSVDTDVVTPPITKPAPMTETGLSSDNTLI